mgnify:CR=1 FL=1
MRGVKKNIFRSFGYVQSQLAVSVRRQRIHRHEGELWKFQGESFQSPNGFEVRLGIGVNQGHQPELADFFNSGRISA